VKASAVALMLAASLPAQAKCLLATQKPMTEVQLLFGRDIPGGGTVSDNDWTAYVNEVVAVAFPDGFTASDAQGTWRDAKTGAAVHEKSKIVFIEASASPELAGRLERVADVYRRRFHQDAVGIVTREVCAAF
jgi:hypothetical protein